ncbi:MAG: PIN domain-containing protein [Desulfobacteraceae bacterium]|nr:PIN domain-containing protein [Desulfobacteraceae bacterium]
MRPFLVDTNIWAYLYYPEKYAQEHPNVVKHMDKIEQSTRLGISVITWGEIAVGLPGNGESSLQKKHLKFIRSKKPWIVGIDTHTAEQYGKLRGRLSLKERGKKQRLVDMHTWLEVGSLENDLWIIAQAMTKDLILVTNDKKSMRPILDLLGDELQTENWAEGTV